MKSEIIKVIEKGLKNYRTKPVRVAGREYTLSIFAEDEDINIFEGFLFTEIEDKSELTHFKNYKAPVSGYTPRMGLILYKEKFLIKDYRRNKHILKTVSKINDTFLKKLKKALAEPKEDNFNKLFDRTDIIEEFYILYKKSREYLLRNIKGLPDEEDRDAFVNNLMMQMLTLWYLQERGFFNNDRSYFITKFKESRQQKLAGDINSYYDFLKHFFDKISNNLDVQFIDDDEITGKVAVVGPAIFLNGERVTQSISIPDKCFYKEGVTETLIKYPPKKVATDVPLLNLFDSRDWTEGDMDEYVLGALYEKLITQDVRKRTGAYYTPEEITRYICKNTIEPYLVDRVNDKFSSGFESVNQIINDGDRKTLLYLFGQLREIKILDPAVGSAHFLESAIDVLLDIYERIWDRAKGAGLRKGLEITASDEAGNIKDINLLEISNEEQFRLYVKFFIILSENIYGVDVNEGALKVAKARLFLTLARHFDANKNYFIRFPNVHFNLRSGNSLVGYVELKDTPKGQTSLGLFVNEDDAVYVKESIRMVSGLGDYLAGTARTLKISGDIVKEIGELNKILSKKTIDWSDFEKVLRIKEKLIKILIVSLNSHYARPLNELLHQITALFNSRLDERFADEHGIDVDELKEIRTFHWVFEFPEVFLDRGGFDVVVGNPPWVFTRGKQFSDHDKEFFNKFLLSKNIKSTIIGKNIQSGKLNKYALFTIRSIDLMHSHSLFSFIISNNLLRSTTYDAIRKYILDNSLIYSIVNLPSNTFIGITASPIILTFRKGEFLKENKENALTVIPEIIDINDLSKNMYIKYKIKQRNFYSSTSYAFNIFIDTNIAEIIKLLEKNTTSLGEICNYIIEGIVASKSQDVFDSRVNDYCKPLLFGKDIGRYKLEYNGKYIQYIRNKLHRPRPEEVFLSRKILIQRVSGGDHPLSATFDSGIFYTFASINNIIIKENANIDIKFLLIIINSELLNWYYSVNFSNKSEFTVNISKTFLEKLPIKNITDKKQGILKKLSNYLLFLNANKERRELLKDTIDFFDRQIADSLVYELYFCEKFHEDGIYPEPKHYLLEAVSKHLKPIEYDRWSDLYWKAQLEENLSAAGEKELARLERTNMETIEEVYQRLRDDKGIQAQIMKIREHPWVRVVEGVES